MSAGGAELLRVDGLSKSFGAMRAVDNVSFVIPQGAIGGLIGPNGAGKTTLFNSLAGHFPVDSGEVHLDGRRIDGLPSHAVFRAGLSRTFQIPRPFAGMSVLENVMLVPEHQAGERFWNNWFRPLGVRADERRNREKAEGIIEFCGLTRVRADLARTLSGGQLKLLELARVLMADPKIILLDEPAAGVNPTLLETLIEKIVELNARGQGFLLIEHNIDMIMRLCDPVLVMARGQLIFEGSAAAAREDPAVLDAYLGEMPA
ncbi:MAG: ABC transporter ATP-binding protein [Geminicoccaceae bacterium]